MDDSTSLLSAVMVVPVDIRRWREGRYFRGTQSPVLRCRVPLSATLARSKLNHCVSGLGDMFQSHQSTASVTGHDVSSHRLCNSLSTRQRYLICLKAAPHRFILLVRLWKTGVPTPWFSWHVRRQCSLIASTSTSSENGSRGALLLTCYASRMIPVCNPRYQKLRASGRQSQSSTAFRPLGDDTSGCEHPLSMSLRLCGRFGSHG